MKELSVAVLGGGRWARALTSLLLNNQRTQRGHIRRVTQYNPPRSGRAAAPAATAPAQLKAAAHADSEDATMMGSLGGLAGALAGKLGKPGLVADSEDATMFGLPSKPARPLHTAESEDATMLGLPIGKAMTLPAGLMPKRAPHTADSDDATMMGPMDGLLTPPAGKPRRPSQTADSEDETMQMTAQSLSRLAAPMAVNVKPQSVLRRSSSDDATMMQMTSADLAAALGQAMQQVAPASTKNDELREVGSADVLFLAVPASKVRTVLRGLKGVLRPNQILLHGIGSLFPAQPELGQSALRISEVVLEETPITRIGALSGPASADDLEEFCPAALVCGSQSETVISAARQVLGCQTLRIYASTDLSGVEVARAMSGVIALASGVCEVLQYGIASRAVLVSRSAAEISRLGMALGGQERTFLGLAGVGGLMVASQRTDSPDFQLGRLLAAGLSLGEAEKQIARVCDSIHMIRDGHSLAEALGVRMPILSMLHRWIFEGVDLKTALRDLLEDANYVE
jgi:glycerol-3-phosphate dehydrogenase (NAD(P)+)